MSTFTQSSMLSTPPTSGSGSTFRKSCGSTTYPPCIAEIIKRPSPRAQKGSTQTSPADSVRSITCIREPRRSRSSRQTISDQSQGSQSSDSVTRHKSRVVNDRWDAISVVGNTAEELAHLRDGMSKTIHEYFPRKMMVNLIELPAFRHLRKRLNALIVALEFLEISLQDQLSYKDDSDISYMMYQIRAALDEVTGEGFRILGGWDHREAGQKEGDHLTGKSWRLRRIAIHDSNAQLENLRKMVIVAEAKILQEQSFRQRLKINRLEWGKGWGWLKYLRTVGGNVEASSKSVDILESAEVVECV